MGLFRTFFYNYILVIYIVYVHEEDMDDALDRFEAQCDQDTPLKFRPFMKTAVRNLRRRLDNRLKFVFLLDEEDDSAYGRRPDEFNQWSQELVFPATSPPDWVHTVRFTGVLNIVHSMLLLCYSLNVIVVIKHVHSMTRVNVIVVIQQLQTKHRLSAKFLLCAVLKVRKSLKDRMEIATIH